MTPVAPKLREKPPFPEAPGGLRENVPLAPLTTFRIGGPARWFAEPATEAELAAAYAWARARGLPVFLLGGGSNLLVDDAGFDGLALRLAGEFRRLKVSGESLVAGAGVLLPKLGREGVKRGLLPYLFLTGIPGTVGGGVRANAGADGGAVADLLKWADVFYPGRGIERLDAGSLGFGYRSSALQAQPDAVLVRAAFRLEGPEVPPDRALALMKEKLAARRARQPRNPRNCGSVFKNPAEGHPAGYLLERAGLKGLSVGGASISRRHANWIVNGGAATAADVKALIELARARVSETCGIRLEREVLYLPEDLPRS